MHWNAVCAIIFCFALGACRPDESAASRAVPEAGQPCTPRVAAVEAFPADSVPESERCRLVNLAVATVGKAEPSTGLVPGDTASIRGATVAPLSQTTPEGALVQATWHVTLHLEGRPYDAEVLVDRASGRVTATRIHKPM